MITEPPRPPPPPDQRPERLLPVDTTTISTNAVYIHAAYEWLHNVARRKCELDAEVLVCGRFFLVLLQAPMVAICTTTGWRFRMMAGILNVSACGLVNGWMIDNHAEARDTFDMLTNPERAMEPAPEHTDEDDGVDYEAHEEDEEDAL